MISHTLNELADKARQIEDLLPGSSPTYRRMYLQLEHDIEIALTRIATSMVKKFNMDVSTKEPDFMAAVNEIDELVIGDTNDPSD